MKQVNNIPTEPGIYVISVEDFFRELDKGNLRGYRNNRGMMVESESRIKKIAEKFNPQGVGMIHIGLFRGELTLADGHHRSYAIKMAFRENKLTPSQKRALIAIKVIAGNDNDFLRTYADLNDQLRHTTNQDVTNPDFRYGDVIFNRLKPALTAYGYDPDAIDNAFSGKRSANLAYVIDALDRSLPMNKWNYVEIYKVRKSAAERFHLPAAEAKILLSGEKMDKLTKAVSYYLDYLGSLLTKAKKKGISLEGINTNASWFGLMLTNLLAEDCRFPKRPNNLADKTISKMSKLNNWVRTMGGADLSTIASSEVELWKTLGLREMTPNWIKSYKPLGNEVKLPKRKEDKDSQLLRLVG